MVVRKLLMHFNSLKFNDDFAMRIISLSVKLLFPLDGILLGCHGVCQFQVVCRNALFRINFNTIVSFSTDCALVTNSIPPSPINK